MHTTAVHAPSCASPQGRRPHAELQPSPCSLEAVQFTVAIDLLTV